MGSRSMHVTVIGHGSDGVNPEISLSRKRSGRGLCTAGSVVSGTTLAWAHRNDLHANLQRVNGSANDRRHRQQLNLRAWHAALGELPAEAAPAAFHAAIWAARRVQTLAGSTRVLRPALAS